jgi:hypothetical protein
VQASFSHLVVARNWKTSQSVQPASIAAWNSLGTAGATRNNVNLIAVELRLGDERQF